MKISKRSLLIVFSLMLALTTAALGTVAYMTDRATVTNTFTVGNIEIIVDETDVDKSQTGVVTPGNPGRDQENDYKLVPGSEHIKDPAITVLESSEECYVRFRLSINMAKELWVMMTNHGVTVTSAMDFLDEMVNIDTNNWEFIKYYESANGSGATEFEFWHKLPGAADAKKVNAANENIRLPSLFSIFTVPNYLTKEDVAALSRLQVDANGDVIQTAAFNDAAAAWEAFDYQVFGIEPTVQPDQGDETGNTDNVTTDNADTTGTGEGNESTVETEQNDGGELTGA